jgi:hypothetical protein
MEVCPLNVVTEHQHSGRQPSLLMCARAVKAGLPRRRLFGPGPGAILRGARDDRARSQWRSEVAPRLVEFQMEKSVLIKSMVGIVSPV